jgi:hypothetical protein
MQMYTYKCVFVYIIFQEPKFGKIENESINMKKWSNINECGLHFTNLTLEYQTHARTCHCTHIYTPSKKKPAP